jgi:hypothetical protein
MTARPVDAEATVRSLSPGGYVDHFDSGGYASYDTVTLDVTRPEPRTVSVILDGVVPVDWRPGVRVRFRIAPEDLTAGVPVFLGSLLDLSQLDEAGP